MTFLRRFIIQCAEAEKQRSIKINTGEFFTINNNLIMFLLGFIIMNTVVLVQSTKLTFIQIHNQ